MQDVSIPRVDATAVEGFQEGFITPERPAILGGAAKDWPARTRWSRDELKSRVGDVSLLTVEGATHLHPDLRSSLRSRQGRLSFAEYVDLVWSGDESASRRFVIGDSTPLLSGGDAVSPFFGSLLEDVIVPPFFDRGALRDVNLWLSAAGVRSWLHYDNNSFHNLNAQVKGKKSVLLYSPADAPRLYPFLYTGELPGFSQYSRVDVEAPDPGRFPAFAGATRFVGTLEEGDVLFIPAFWFHSFKHLGPVNINVNFWWRPERQVMHGLSKRLAFWTALSRALPAGAPRSPGPAAALSRLPDEMRALLHQLELRLLDPSGIMGAPAAVEGK